MGRLMSVSMTEQAVVDRLKTVTRRKGWWLDKNGRRLLHPGDRLTLCRKVQGRKPGEPIERLAEVEVVDVRREPLCAVAERYVRDQNGSYVWPEVVAEGFPEMGADEFMRRFFIDAQRIQPMDDVTRIEWRYLDTVVSQPRRYAWSAECEHDDGSTWYLERATRYLARRSLDAHLHAEHGITRSPAT